MDTSINMGMKVAFSRWENPTKVAAPEINTSPTDLAAVPASVAKNPEFIVPLAHDLGMVLDSKLMLGPSRRLVVKKMQIPKVTYCAAE